jgi:predicted transcriptional regulator
MGLFNKIFGGEKEYPVLEPSSPAAQRLSRFNGALESFVQKVSDKLEMVPTDNTLYVFIGNPPKMFGIAWFNTGEDREHNFKTLMSQEGLSQGKIQNLSDELRNAYTRNNAVEKYSATIAGKKITVSLSDALADDIHQIIQKVYG